MPPKLLAHVEQWTIQAEQLAARMGELSDPEQLQQLGRQYDELQHRLEHHGGYAWKHKVERVLDGLQFSSSQRDQPANQLSGGQRNRLVLARLLLESPDVLILDEPSNHLDVEATSWLEDYLVDSASALLIVSHDRYFLDRVATTTLELLHGTIDAYSGNYSHYVQQKELRLETQRRTYERQQAEIARMEDFVRRNMVGQKHAQAEDRRKKLERIERVEPPRETPLPPMGLSEPERSGDIVLRVEGLAKGFDTPLFADLGFDVLRGEKWGVLGPNGCGKTTLLRCLLGELPADQGKAQLGAKVKIAYFDQMLANLPPEEIVLEAVRPDGSSWQEQQRRDLLARFGVTGDMVFQPIRSLSGGERSRVALARLSATEANLLVLDEPTNHLDLWSREALERTLKGFAGTILFVSHDRYFVQQIADHLLVCEDGRFRIFEGGYAEYLASRKSRGDKTEARTNPQSVKERSPRPATLRQRRESTAALEIPVPQDRRYRERHCRQREENRIPASAIDRSQRPARWRESENLRR